MNNRQLAQIGLGLLGVWALLTAVAEFVQIVAVASASIAILTLAEIVPMGLLLGLSYVLVFHNAKVATAIFPDIDGIADAEPHDLSRTLVALTGAMLLVRGTPSALNVILSYLSVDSIDPTLRGRIVRPLIGSLVPIGAGIYLIARPERLIAFLQRPSPKATRDHTDELPIA